LKLECGAWWAGGLVGWWYGGMVVWWHGGIVAWCSDFSRFHGNHDTLIAINIFYFL